MQKRTKIIIFLVVTVISVLYILSVYFDVIRYIRVHSKNRLKNSKKYASLPKASDSRVVLSLGPNEERVGKLYTTLNSLIDQTVKVDQICINVPYSFKVPEEYNEVANIYRTGVDYKEAAKYKPTLYRETDKNSTLIYLRDDVVYGKDFIENILRVANENPGKAIIIEPYAVLVKPDYVDTEKLEKSSSKWGVESLLESLKTDSIETYKSLF